MCVSLKCINPIRCMGFLTNALPCCTSNARKQIPLLSVCFAEGTRIIWGKSETLKYATFLLFVHFQSFCDRLRRSNFNLTYDSPLIASRNVRKRWPIQNKSIPTRNLHLDQAYIDFEAQKTRTRRPYIILWALVMLTSRNEPQTEFNFNHRKSALFSRKRFVNAEA